MIKVDANAIAPKPRARSSAPAPDGNRRCKTAWWMAMTLPAPGAGFRWTRESWGDALRCDPLAAHAQHVFTSKQLALPAAAGWRAALASVHSTPERLMRVKQVHGNAVRVLKRGHIAARRVVLHQPDRLVVSVDLGLAVGHVEAGPSPGRAKLVERRLLCGQKAMRRHGEARGLRGRRYLGPKLRVFRLLRDRALVNRLGFNNGGAAEAARRLAHRADGTVGINIGKTKRVSEAEALADYTHSAKALAPLADYPRTEVNAISSDDRRLIIE
jgi:hypothetical protein